MRPTYDTVLSELRLLERIRKFQPIVIGTPPLGIDVETSDIDIACSADDLHDFSETIESGFSKLVVECKHMRVRGEPTACARLRSKGWDIELFCQAVPVEQQSGVRHFEIERRLLNLIPDLRPRVLLLKKQGLKTEPAFAQLLGLSGDPYEAMLKLESAGNEELAELAAGSSPA